MNIYLDESYNLQHGKGKIFVSINGFSINFLTDHFPDTRIHFHKTASYQDILLELADFISNTFYREYQQDKIHIFSKFGFKMIQIKNPLKRADILQAPFGDVVASKGCS